MICIVIYAHIDTHECKSKCEGNKSRKKSETRGNSDFQLETLHIYYNFSSQRLIENEIKGSMCLPMVDHARLSFFDVQTHLNRKCRSHLSELQENI